MTFATELIAICGTAADAYDIKAITRRCYFYDFDGYPVRLWEGQGVLYAGGYEWIGTFDAMGRNHHIAPAVRDSRDGTSPRYEFTVPYLDATTYAALAASQDLARGRDLIFYNVLCLAGEGLRPTTDLRFNYRLAMRGVRFSKRMESDPQRLVYSASVVAKSLEYGRSRVPAGTMTDTAQRERARQLGVTEDSGCSMVAKNSRRTFIVAGG